MHFTKQSISKLFKRGKRPLYYTIQALIVIAVVTAVIYAWQEPTEQPPGGNIAAPLNTGDTAQRKTGGLCIGGTGTCDATTGELKVISKLTVVGTMTFPGTLSLTNLTVSGKVGIGTTTPGRILHLSAAGFNSLRTTDTTTGGGTWDIGGPWVAGDGNAVFQRISGAGNLLLVPDGGKVGIGTIEPRGLLDVGKEIGVMTVGTGTPPIMNSACNQSLWGMITRCTNGGRRILCVCSETSPGLISSWIWRSLVD
jgi:hypothetical protein